jgi:DnaJ-class molecular chaperone
MADPDDAQSTAQAPTACAPCRGTGQVISNLGGSPSHVTCPWCEGGGMLISGHDAQAARAAATA